ncbi:response regulator transcription factor [Pseudoalteromonas sp. M8]|uniref:response regulator transcription factor n=1 Tax=Pseudoalteromonas sp. M8 TaxID=2692624 RepID=UPI001BAB6983|nr:response regulator transcription factor [Pseudoalteromonas sp. M8]QUI69010.1 response regulator [Pseudoalteromonas sp. M8]
MVAELVLIEDDKELAQWLSDYLSTKGFSVRLYHDGQDGLEHVLASPPDLVILDGMLPSLDGFEVCKQLRLSLSIPILMLTARDEEIDEIIGLEMGADDYLKKPVRGRLLETRIKALLRRHQPQHPAPKATLEFGTLYINKEDRNVTLAKQPVNLSSNEFDALWVLASKAGKIVTRDELTKALRGFDYDGFDRSIDLRVSRLRKKLGDDGQNPFKIKTVWGKGYQLAKDVW